MQSRGNFEFIDLIREKTEQGLGGRGGDPVNIPNVFRSPIRIARLSFNIEAKRMKLLLMGHAVTFLTYVVSIVNLSKVILILF